MEKKESALPEYAIADRRTYLSGVGYTDEALNRVMIGVVNTWGEINPAAFHLNQVTKAVKAGIWAAGGTPVEFVISSVCTGMGGPDPFNLPHREFVAGYIEAVSKLNLLDGLVLIPVCDDVVPAHLMAAARLNIPSIVLTGGYMLLDRYKGKEIDPFDISTEYFPALLEGKLSASIFNCIKERACMGMGACPDMATANTMAAMSEALGMSLPGNASIPGAGSRLLRLGYNAGNQLLKLHKMGIRPSDIMTHKSFENAIRVLMAIGGSTNAILHLQAIASELDLDISLDTFNRLQETTPFICNVSPSGQYSLKDLDDAGGILAVVKELQPLMNSEVLTVTGYPLGENLKDVQVFNRKVIYSLREPIAKEGGLVFLKGNLAPKGAIIKQSAVVSEMLKFRGPARIFLKEADACDALIRKEILPGEVVILRYLGPKGDPGMNMVFRFLWLLVGLGLDHSIALVTDGRLSGTNKGCAVAHVAPEAAEGGPLAVVEDGDIIEIDIPNRKLNIEITEDELRKRLQMWKPKEVTLKRGILSLYAKMAQSTDKGAGIKY